MKSGDGLGALRSKEPEIKTWGFAEGCPLFDQLISWFGKSCWLLGGDLLLDVWERKEGKPATEMR